MDSERVLKLAKCLSEIRRCTDKDAALMQEGGELPCSFCRWSKEATYESGCIAWAESIINDLISAGALPDRA